MNVPVWHLTYKLENHSVANCIKRIKCGNCSVHLRKAKNEKSKILTLTTLGQTSSKKSRSGVRPAAKGTDHKRYMFVYRTTLCTINWTQSCAGRR